MVVTKIREGLSVPPLSYCKGNQIFVPTDGLRPEYSSDNRYKSSPRTSTNRYETTIYRIVTVVPFSDVISLEHSDMTLSTIGSILYMYTFGNYTSRPNHCI